MGDEQAEPGHLDAFEFDAVDVTEGGTVGFPFADSDDLVVIVRCPDEPDTTFTGDGADPVEGAAGSGSVVFVGNVAAFEGPSAFEVNGEEAFGGESGLEVVGDTGLVVTPDNRPLTSLLL